MSTTDFTHTLQLLTEMMAVQQRSLMDAQLATYKHLTQLYTPQAPSESQRANLSSHVDDTLSASQSLMLAHVQAGKAVWAECGGMLALGHSIHTAEGEALPMWGILPGTASMQPRLAGLGMQECVLHGGQLPCRAKRTGGQG